MSYENFDPNDLLIQAFSIKPEANFGPHRIPHGIRAVHLPTGTVVTCDTDRSQHRNRHLALTELWEQVHGKPTYQELAAQLKTAESMHLDNVRYIWESRNCGSCSELAEKHDQLAATVEALRLHLAEFQKTETLEDAVAWEDKTRSLVKATPQQHLRDVRAEAGRIGWVRCVDYLVDNSHSSEFTDKQALSAYNAASEHAERVKAGEK